MKKLLFFAVGAFFMLFTACNTESVSLEGSWIIETAYGQPVIAADTAMITFDTKEMRVAGCNGCNRFFGPYSVSEGKSVALKNLATTMMACPDSPSETDIMRAFNETATYSIKKEADKTRLFFYNDKKDEVMGLVLQHK